MPFRRRYADDYDTPADREETYQEDVSHRPVASMSPFSPAQIIGLIAGIGFTALGIAAVARTGFDTGHIYTPQAVVWHLPHSPLLALIEIGWGVLMIIASIVPGGLRSLMGLLGAISLAFGIVILVNANPGNLSHWFAVTQHRSGWFYTIVGAVVVLFAFLSPVFVSGARRHEYRAVHHPA